MLAITLSPPAATAVTTGWATRIVGVVGSRLAPSADGLEERAGWRIKTRWIIGASAAVSAASAVDSAPTPVLLAIPMVLIVFTPPPPVPVPGGEHGQPGVVVRGGAAPDADLRSDPPRPRSPLRRPFGPTRAQRLMLRFGLLGVALRPTSKGLAAAGACRLRTSRVLAADASGTIGRLVSIGVGTPLAVG